MSRYSRLSIPLNELSHEATETQVFFDSLNQFWNSAKLSPELVLKIYMCAYQVLRTPRTASFQNRLPLGERAPNSKVRAQELKQVLLNQIRSQSEIPLIFFVILEEELNFLFSEYNFISIPGEVTLQLHELAKPNHRLRVINYIPLPHELLKLQADGWRVVTLHTSVHQRGLFVDGKRDCFEFALHDLSHAYKFFHAGSFADQVEFFRLFFQWMIAQPELYDSSSTALKNGLDYVMSDMNSHPKHLLQTLEAHLNLAHIKMPLQYRQQFENLALKG